MTLAYQKALVIDDDPMFRIVAEATLRKLGVPDVAHASDGDEGLRILLETTPRFDLILCDLQMPRLDGISVIRELGQVRYEGALVTISSEDKALLKSARQIAEMTELKMLGALSKPLVPDELLALLSSPAEAITRPARTPITRHGVKSALADKRICPVYQPKICFADQSLAGVEVLARMRGPDGSLGSPAACLQAATLHGLMDEFTFAMIDRVLDDVRVWTERGIKLPIAINLPPSWLHQLDLPDRLVERCRSAVVDPRRVTLEITENQFISHEATVLDVLSRLRLFGFRLSMDDFGTGATSIEQMRLYPFNEMKIDRRFIADAETDEFARTTAMAAGRLAQMLGLTVVAEGIETAVQLAFAHACGAHVGQGFLLGKPMPVTPLIDWVDQFNTSHRNVA